MMTSMTEAEWNDAVEELTRDPRIVNLLLAMPGSVPPRLPDLVSPGQDGEVQRLFSVTSNMLYDTMTKQAGEPVDLRRANGLVPCALLRLAEEIGLIAPSP